MLASEIISKVMYKCRESSFSAEDILDILNRGRWEICGTVKLPALMTTDTVTTTADAGSVALPSGYHHGLWYVYSASQSRRIGRREEDYTNPSRFYARGGASSSTGDILQCCVFGSNLLYTPRAADTLTLTFFQEIEDIAATEEPSELPKHLHEQLLANYCLREIYDEIEDETNGPKNNTDRYNNYFQRAMASLREYVFPLLPHESKNVDGGLDFTGDGKADNVQ